MAHLQTPPRQSSSSRAKTFGLITPSTPVHLTRYSKDPQQCPDAPFLPANFFPVPSQTLRTSPRTKKGDPIKPMSSTTHVRTRTVTGDRGTLLQPGMPPTPAETPVQKRRRREEEMRRRIEENNGSNTTTTSRRLFPLKPVMEDAVVITDTSAAPTFEIFTDSMHRTPVSSPNNPFAFDNYAKDVVEPRGLSPKKRKYNAPIRKLRAHEMHYSFRGQRIVRKVAPGPNGESWRDTVRPVRLFQTEIAEAEERQLKRRKIVVDPRDVEEVETEEESGDEEMMMIRRAA